MKVLYIIDTLTVGGAEKSLVEIAVKNKSVTSCFLTIYKGDALVKVLEENGIEVFQLNLSDRYAFDKAAKLIKPLFTQIKPDIIHSTLFRADIVARQLRGVFNGPIINSFVNNSYNKLRYNNLSLSGKVRLYGVQFYDKITASKVDHFISNSETIKISNGAALNVNAAKTTVIYRGRSPEKFNLLVADDVSALKKELGIGEEKVLLNVSRLLDRKGQLDLVEAFAHVIKQGTNAILLIAGDGNFKSAIEDKIAALDLTGKVKLLGNRNDVPALLSIADVFVFPSHYEGLPGALIEAMFAKKIIICSDISENKECVAADEAVFFSKGNVNELGDKMLKVINDLPAYQALGEKAHTVALKKFEINAVIAQYNNIYNKLLTGRIA